MGEPAKAKTDYSLLAARATGCSHLKARIPCQDHVHTGEIELDDGSKAVILALSDGAGSAAQSSLSSEMLVEGFVEIASRKLRERLDLIKSNVLSGEPEKGFYYELMQNIFANCRERVVKKASSEGKGIKDFHATLVGAIVLIAPDGARKIITAAVGDSVAILLQEKEQDLLNCSSFTGVAKGEYVNQVVFITSDSWRDVFSCNLSEDFQGIFISSDGLDKLYFFTKFQEEVEDEPLHLRYKWEIKPNSKYINRLVEKIVVEDVSSKLLAEEFLSHKELHRVNGDDKSLIILYFPEDRYAEKQSDEGKKTLNTESETNLPGPGKEAVSKG